MATHQRRLLVDKMDQTYSIAKQCALLQLHRSGVYYQPASATASDLAIMRIMDELYLEDPTRGTRRYMIELNNRGYAIGRDKVRTYMRIMDLKPIYCMPRTTVIDKAAYKYPYLLRNISITYPNQVWAMDISYIPMRYGFMYLLAIIDIYSRYIVGWSLSNTMEADWIVTTTKQTIEEHSLPGIINTDQGSQFTSEEYIGYVKSLKTVRISMDGKGRATDNAFIERFFRTIKYDKLYLEPAVDGTHLWQQCQQFIDYYNNKRIHSSIGNIPPIKAFRYAA